MWIDPFEDYHSSQDVPRGGNAPGWRDEHVDRLLEEMRLEFDDEKRTEMFHEFNKLWHDAQPELRLIHSRVAVVVNKRFEGVKIRAGGLQSFEFWVEPENVLHK